MMMREAECPVCLGFFADPLMLLCGHSVCSGCVATLRAPGRANAPCPTCRADNLVPQPALVCNFDLKAVVDKLHRDHEHYEVKGEAPVDDDAFRLIGMRHAVAVCGDPSADGIVVVQPIVNGPHIAYLSALMKSFYDTTPWPGGAGDAAAAARRFSLLPTDAIQPINQVQVARATAAVKAPARRPIVLCAAEFGDRNYRRAIITERVSVGHVRVYFVDHGYETNVPINKLFALPNHFRSTPYIAHRCRLAEPPALLLGKKLEQCRLLLLIESVGADGVPIALPIDVQPGAS